LYYVAIVGAGLFLALRFFPEARIDAWGPLLWWLAFASVAEISPIMLPGSQAYITVSSALDYAAIVVFGPTIAAMIAAVTALASSLVVSRQPVHKALFNVCLFIVTIFAAGYVFKLAGGTATPEIRELVLPMAACGITYFLIDTFGVSTIVALSQKVDIWRIWQRTYLWTTITHLVGFVPLGAIIVVIFLHIGIPGVGLFLVPLMLARYSFKLYTDMRKVHFDTVRALTSAIDASDPYTRGHSERVTHYSVAIARDMRLSERRVQAIEYAGFLHDMGKIGINHGILTKPGSLTDDEWQAMKEHPAIGARIVSDLDFLKGAREVVLYHHERYDGKGYPEGLAGEQIPLEARIAKVADAFDAMMSNRPYRSSLGLQKSVQELEDGKGTEFDPKVVEAFLAVLDAGKVEVVDLASA
ncbi:MAG: HD-GYP domain-containing protein, partial [Candidatus Eisenbacteria sp.]|nr:HD-GYP domain-containing protein [Candidatus Eisenbacteria bacterium]